MTSLRMVVPSCTTTLPSESASENAAPESASDFISPVRMYVRPALSANGALLSACAAPVFWQVTERLPYTNSDSSAYHGAANATFSFFFQKSSAMMVLFLRMTSLSSDGPTPPYGSSHARHHR